MKRVGTNPAVNTEVILPKEQGGVNLSSKFCSKKVTEALPFLPHWGAIPPNPAWDPSPLTYLQRFWEAKEALTLQWAQCLKSPAQGLNTLSSVHSRNEIFQLWHEASHVCWAKQCTDWIWLVNKLLYAVALLFLQAFATIQWSTWLKPANVSSESVWFV